ncbi:MAG TPA: cation diffusion facilitator family transporter [Bacteroidales bacterium]|nr:cation diffusion facilitator family transporter [Bacteroidales bacterium]
MSKPQHSCDYERSTRYVVILTTVTMIVETIYGLTTHSMALLADGIHMGSHVLAIGLSLVAYIAVRKIAKDEQYADKSNKILCLSGYSSGLLLLVFAFLILYCAVGRIINPSVIQYKEAILVALIGLLVNMLSAVLLKHDREHSDQNIKAAYLHVLADALTSVTAILGLTAALLWNIAWLDTIGALISTIIIIQWSIGLLKDSGRTLLGLGTN